MTGHPLLLSLYSWKVHLGSLPNELVSTILAELIVGGKSKDAQSKVMLQTAHDVIHSWEQGVEWLHWIWDTDEVLTL